MEEIARRKTDKLTNSHLEIDRSIDEHIIQEPRQTQRGCENQQGAMMVEKKTWRTVKNDFLKT